MAIAANSFEMYAVMGSAFISGAELQPADLVSRILSAWATQYDGPVHSWTLPQQAPADFPSVILQNRDSTARLEVSRVRVNVHTTGAVATTKAALGTIAQQLAWFSELDEVKITRLGAVAHSFAKCEHAALTLARHFCRPELLQDTLKRPEALEVHAHKAYTPPNSERINSWFRCRTGSITVTAGAESAEAILIEQDLNMVAGKESPMNRLQIEAFFETCAAEFPSIVKVYFPTEAF